MSDIYSAPQAELNKEGSGGSFGSIAKALAGDYAVAIGDTLSEAWQRTKGNKGTIWLGVLLYSVAALVINFVAGLITGYSAYDPEAAAQTGGASVIAFQLLVAIASAPLAAGMMMIGVKIARDEAVSGTEVFAYFDKIVPLAIGFVLMYVLSGIGFLLLVLPGFYLFVAYMMFMPLIIDKRLGPWQALETSRKAISKHWFAFFGFIIVLILLYFAGALALLIGLIWAIPTLSIAYGIVYRNMFGGPDSDTSADAAE